ncbi:MAG: hypothetical protein ACYSTN_06460, partial [Planctomycetota bacterium]
MAGRAGPKTCGTPLNICHLYGALYYTKFRRKINRKRQKNQPQRTQILLVSLSILCYYGTKVEMCGFLTD